MIKRVDLENMSTMASLTEHKDPRNIETDAYELLASLQKNSYPARKVENFIGELDGYFNSNNNEPNDFPRKPYILSLGSEVLSKIMLYYYNDRANDSRTTYYSNKNSIEKLAGIIEKNSYLAENTEIKQKIENLIQINLDLAENSSALGNLNINLKNEEKSFVDQKKDKELVTLEEKAKNLQNTIAMLEASIVHKKDSEGYIQNLGHYKKSLYEKNEDLIQKNKNEDLINLLSIVKNINSPNSNKDTRKNDLEIIEESEQKLITELGAELEKCQNTIKSLLDQKESIESLKTTRAQTEKTSENLKKQCKACSQNFSKINESIKQSREEELTLMEEIIKKDLTGAVYLSGLAIALPVGCIIAGVAPMMSFVIATPIFIMVIGLIAAAVCEAENLNQQRAVLNNPREELNSQRAVLDSQKDIAFGRFYN